MNNNLIVNIASNIRSKATTTNIMRDVIIALLPTLVAATVIFGGRSLLVTAVCVAACVIFEWAFEKITKRQNTIGDLSAVVTGILLAFNLPVGIPLWQAVIGCLVAIVVVKQLFGGIGCNFANPAITARIAMLLAFSGTMTTWELDGVSTATPLALLKGGEVADLSTFDLFFGIHGGCLGETCAFTLLLGGIYLIIRGVITWHTPVAFIATVFVLTALYGHSLTFGLQQILSGGVMIGAIFMATDYATTPSTNAGRLIFGFGCALITVLIRLWGNYPEGVSFSILLMNILTPYISRWTRSKPLGGVKQ